MSARALWVHCNISLRRLFQLKLKSDTVSPMTSKASPDISSIIDAMQRAVDIVSSSPHHVNKISATIFNENESFSSTNIWPQTVRDTIGIDARIGSSSGTVHAEVNCLLHFKEPTEGASLCITDPFCPNCAKNLAESGIKRIYIDHKGFDKDFAQRRGEEFKSMSFRIATRAGISLYTVWRKEGRIEPIHEVPDDYVPPQNNPIKIEKTSVVPNIYALNQIIASTQVIHKRWACALAKNAQGENYFLVASAHPAIGFTREHDADIISHKEGKYSFYLEPLNRILMGAHRYGLRLIDGLIWSSEVPTSRELVNCIGANIKTICLGNDEAARDEEAIAASRTLADAGIMQFISL